MSTTIVLTALGLGCGPQPTTLDYPSEVTLHDRSLQIPEAKVLDADGERLELPVQVLSSNRAEVVQLTTGGFSCLGNGDAELQLKAGSLEHRVLVHCALVERLELSATQTRLVLPKEDGQLQPQTLQPPTVRVLGPDGAPAYIDPVAVSSRPEVLSVQEDGTLQALRPGRAVVTYTAGGRKAEYTVDIGRLIDDRLTLTVPPGGRSTLPLEPGPTWVDLSAPVRIEAHLEGERCPEPQTASRIEDLYCELGDRGMLVVHNPSRSTVRVRAKLVVVPG
ncbi:MAG: hypothetical protein VX899_24855 [Myxococcota bacterium]|nr:hypothetical protein [Myxococcota bacterium]